MDNTLFTVLKSSAGIHCRIHSLRCVYASFFRYMSPSQVFVLANTDANLLNDPNKQPQFYPFYKVKELCIEQAQLAGHKLERSIITVINAANTAMYCVERQVPALFLNC